LGAILAIIAPVLFHFLLQTNIRMRDIGLIMISIVFLSIIPALDFVPLENLVRHLPPNVLVKATLFLAVTILAIWRLIYLRNKRKKE
jgi:hypothetical protein